MDQYQLCVVSCSIFWLNSVLNTFYSCFYNLSSFLVGLFIHFERERESDSMSGEGKRERERERIPSTLHTVSTEPVVGLELMNPEIMTPAEIKSQMLKQLSQPGTL